MAWLDESEFVAVVGAAARAPSMLNSQPWRFRRRADTIDLLVDPDRRLPVVDSTGWAARIGCGAALFNLRLALAALGRPAVVTALPEYDDPYLLARLTPDRPRPPSPMEAQLYRAIPRRHSNRGPFADEPVPLPVRGKLSSAARAEEAWLDLLIGPVAVEATALMVRAADDVLCRDAAYQAETAAWVRRSTAVTDGIRYRRAGRRPGRTSCWPAATTAAVSFRRTATTNVIRCWRCSASPVTGRPTRFRPGRPSSGSC